MEKTTNVGAIKKYFESDLDTNERGRPVTMAEMKALTNEDRQELGSLCAKRMNLEVQATA